MACSSSTTKQDLRQMKSFEKEDILTQSAKNVRSFQERTMGPEDVELTDNENSFEENFSCDDDDDNNIDTDEYDEDEDTRFLDVCMDGDIEDLVQLLEEMAQAGETLSTEMLNCADSTDRVPVSYLCGNGMIEMLELVEDIPGIDYNAPDTEGNTPLHYAAQAGHVEVVTFLLNKVRTIQVDPINILGFTPLMKAAIQGRVKCSKLLLISGASSSRRDYGRGYTAPQWARYLNRELCAESMEKFVRTAALPGVSLADILADPRTIMRDIENSNSSSSRSKRRSNKSPARLKEMFKKKKSVLYEKVGAKKRNSKDKLDSKYADDNFVEEIGTVSTNHSKSWLTKALRKVLKVPTTYSSSKPITKDVIEDQSIMMTSSNGFQMASSDIEGNLKTEAISDNTSQTEKNEMIFSRTSEGGKQENNVVIHEKYKSGKKSDMINVSTKKKSSSGKNSNPTHHSNEYSKKHFVIPSLVITKVETLNFNDDDDDDDDEYDSS